MNYEPRIIAFLCTWCSYTGADTAGIARIKSPANIRDIRVPCSGRVSPELVMRTFDQGADGVLVLGCHIGECHYDTGNHRAAKRLPILQSLMSFAGLQPERLRLDWVSASEGERYSRIATEFTEAVRALGPISWRVAPGSWQPLAELIKKDENEVPMPEFDCAGKTDAIRMKAKELLSNSEVECVIGYEISPRGRTRPAFIYSADDTSRLVWNPDVSNNLVSYLPEKFKPNPNKETKKIAVVVKPCDSRAINVLLAEKQFAREQIHVIGVTCEGVRDPNGNMQSRCQSCIERTPVVYDTLIGEPQTSNTVETAKANNSITALEAASPEERMEFWLSQFDRCIRCYACRQACPLCNCPECLYERDDSTFVGLGIGLNEKRTFHLGRAYHLAGRCVGCNECERVCPMHIPIGLLNQKLAEEIAATFNHHAGQTIAPSPIVTILSGDYKES
jgi:coenzyme F420-reducing hydrogenase delta subunit/ferredoxin